MDAHNWSTFLKTPNMNLTALCAFHIIELQTPEVYSVAVTKKHLKVSLVLAAEVGHKVQDSAKAFKHSCSL